MRILSVVAILLSIATCNKTKPNNLAEQAKGTLINPFGTGFYQKFPTIANTISNKKYNFTTDTVRFKVTNKSEDMYLFRVPTLRNITLTSPYFHNGFIKSRYLVTFQNKHYLYLLQLQAQLLSKAYNFNA